MFKGGCGEYTRSKLFQVITWFKMNFGTVCEQSDPSLQSLLLFGPDDPPSVFLDVAYDGCSLYKTLMTIVSCGANVVPSVPVLHTSASLALNENWDPYVRDDMEMMLNKIVPEVCGRV